MVRRHSFWVACAALAVVGTTGTAQPPGEGRGSEGRGEYRSRGFGDPSEWFDRLSKGKDVIVIDQLDERSKFMISRMAQNMGITNGQISRDQFKSAMDSFRSQMGGGFRGPGGGPGGPGGPGGSMTVINRGPENSPEQTDREAEGAFRRHDRDNDGMLRADEMSSSLRPMWETYDKNKDGAVDLNEYKGYYRDRQQARTQDVAGQPPQAVPGQPGPAAPVDGLPPPPSGPAQVEEDERRPVVYRLGKLPKELPAWFAELDTDKDGQVGLYEWVKGGRAVDEYKGMDRNDDGLMTIEEVLSFTRNGNKHPSTDTAVGSPTSEDRGRSSRFGGDRGGPSSGRSWGDSGRGGPPGMRPDFGRGGPPSGDFRSRGESSGRESGGYPSKSRYGRGPDRGGSDNSSTDGGRSDAPKDGKDKRDKKDRKERS